MIIIMMFCILEQSAKNDFAIWHKYMSHENHQSMLIAENIICIPCDGLNHIRVKNHHQPFSSRVTILLLARTLISYVESLIRMFVSSRKVTKQITTRESWSMKNILTVKHKFLYTLQTIFTSFCLSKTSAS